MGRIILILGILLLVGGIVGMASSALGMIGGATSSILPSNFQSAMELATDPKVREAKLCEPGETLIEENGAVSYTPGMGYASTAILYCENSDGERREVTGEFANQLLGQVDDMVSGLVPNIFAGIGRSLLFSGLMVVGIVFTIIGAVMSSRRRRMMTDAFGNLVPEQSGATFSIGGKNVTTTPEVARYIQQAQAMKGTPSVNVMSVGGAAGGDLKGRLNQLEEARKAGLLSQEEFDRLRQQILDTLK